MADPQALELTFTARLGKARPGDTWTCVQLPDSASIFGTRSLVKVAGTVDGHPFTGEVGGQAAANLVVGPKLRQQERRYRAQAFLPCSSGSCE